MSRPTLDDVLRGLDAHAERWGDESRFKRHRDELRAIVARQFRESTTQPTRELFDRLGAITSPPAGEMLLHGISWMPRWDCPCIHAGLSVVDIDTIAKLRAACLLLGIDWPEEKE